MRWHALEIKLADGAAYRLEGAGKSESGGRDARPRMAGAGLYAATARTGPSFVLSSIFPGSDVMVKHLVLGAFLTCSAATAYAQPQQATSPPPRREQFLEVKELTP
jgi:hypothetical protein